MYADDSQLYVDFSPCDEKTALANLQRCIQEVREWLREDFLLLNDKKTEAVIFGKDTSERQLQIGNSVISSRSICSYKFSMYFGFKIEHVATRVRCL